MRNFKPKRLKILPPDPIELERARALRIKQRRANDILREIFFYVIFLVLLLLVTTGFRDPNAFMLKKSLQITFFPDEYDNVSFGGHLIYGTFQVNLCKLYMTFVHMVMLDN